MASLKNIHIDDFEDILDFSKDGFWVTSLDGKILEVNKTYCELSEYTRDELLNMYIKDVEVIQSEEDIKNKIQHIVTHGSDIFETVHRTKSGNSLDFEIVVNHSKSHNYFVVFLRDITKKKQFQKELEIRKESLNKAQKIAKIGHWELNIPKNKLSWSDEVFRIFGLDVGEVEVSYDSFLEFIHPDDRDMVNNAYADSLKTWESYNIVHRIVTKSGDIRYVEEVCEHETNANNEIVKSIGTVQDITTTREYEQSLKLSAEVFTHAGDSILITDSQNNIIKVNKAFEEQTGYTKDEVIGKNPRVLNSGWGDKTFYQNLWNELLTKGIWRGEIWDKKKNGELFVATQTIVVLKDDYDEIANFISIATDTTETYKEKVQKEKALKTSPISGLKNKYAFFEEIKKYDSCKAALININKFYQLTIFYGYDITDKLLANLSSFIMAEFTNSYELYHFDTHKFIILSDDPSQELMEFSLHINNFINKINAMNIKVDGIDFALSLTAAVSEDKSTRLMNSLDMALLYAKQNKHSFWLHNALSDQTKKIEDNLFWVGELKKAFEEDRIVVYFQAIYSYNSNSIQRYEALVRLIQGDGSIVTPNYFLDVAEEANLMGKITEVVFLKTLEFARQNKAFTFSVNISTTDIENESFLKLVKEHLSDTALASRICFEILETHQIEDIQAFENFAVDIHKLGAKTAMDDFGSGFANFENLIKLQTDIIKIDGTLIDSILSNDGAYDIVSSIVSFAKKRGINTIAEYVRNKDIFNAIQKLGIDYAQGYYIGKPLPLLEGENIDLVNKTNLKTLAYVSEAHSKITYETASDILTSSWNHNRANNIAGILLYEDKYFIQLLSGEKDKVDQTFKRIQEDPRHQHIQLLGEASIDTAEFEEWNMGHLPNSSIVNDIFEKHGVKRKEGLYEASFDEVKSLLKELTLVV